MADSIDQGLGDCGDGIPYADGSVGEAAAMSAYAVLRCCHLITAGDWRVPKRIGQSTQEMVASRAKRRAAMVVKLHGPVVVLPPALSREQYARAGDAIMRLRAAENHSHDATIDAVWEAIKGSD